MLSSSELVLRMVKVVEKSVKSKIKELHVYSDNFSTFSVTKDGKKVSVSICIEEEKKDGN